MSFASLGLNDGLLRAVLQLGYDEPTDIQKQAIPPALAGRDVLASAMTGSGKTAAFLLPILQRLHGQPRGTTRALVLAPTRELAGQIHDSFQSLARHVRVSSAAIYGGVGMGAQARALRDGVDVIIATPGRLLDHLRGPQARLRGVEVLVLDEADRMLDMGFLPDVRRILSHVPTVRQTLFFSATLPPPITALSRDMLKNPVTIHVQRRTAPAAGITQAVYPVPGELKPALLVELLRQGRIKSVIAFTRTKHRANRLADFLARHGVAAGRIHGNRSQAQRTQALDQFKAGQFPVLVATDIAARGIDVEALSHVINFDVPLCPEDYIHRVGRTARAGATGEAFLFVSNEEQGSLRGIERVLGTCLPRRTVEGFDYARRPAGQFEVPIAERLRQMRAQRQPAARAPHAAQRPHAPRHARAGAPAWQRSARSGARRPAAAR